MGKTFTVIGYYADTRQRYMDSFIAPSAEAAEDDAENQNPGLTVCGVVLGSHSAADTTRTSVDE